jgi:hypothetical protein
LVNKSRKVYNKVSSSSLGRKENRHRASRLGLENWKLKSRVFGVREYGGGERARSWNGKGRLWLQVRAEVEPLDLTEDNVQHVLLDARSEVRRDSSNSFSSYTHPHLDWLIPQFLSIILSSSPLPFSPLQNLRLESNSIVIHQRQNVHHQRQCAPRSIRHSMHCWRNFNSIFLCKTPSILRISPILLLSCSFIPFSFLFFRWFCTLVDSFQSAGYWIHS